MGEPRGSIRTTIWGPILALLAALCLGLTLTASPASAGTGLAPWVDQALDLQYELGSDVGMDNAPWVGTHNSFNSTAEMGQTISAQDSNQAIDLTDQLRINIRSLELDLHRFPRGDGYRPVVCHGLEGGAGCTYEKTLDPVLAKIARYLRRPNNRDQVLFIYLENDLQTVEMHDDATQVIENEIGDMLYRPPSTGQCNELPGELTRNDIRAAGKQVVLVANCGPGNWHTVIHTWDGHRESRPFDYEDFPSCGPDYTREEYDSSLVRYYEDSTELTAQFGTPDDGITPETAAMMARCGVDQIGLDQVKPFDPRLRSLIWSWSPGEPSVRGACAQIYAGQNRQFGRWVARKCRSQRRRSACLSSAGEWIVPKHRKRGWFNARRVCRKFGAELAVPRTGYENQLLRTAMQDAGVRAAWLGYHSLGGVWTTSLRTAADRR